MLRTLTCFLLVAFAAPCFGQALADKMPDNAVVYISWSGSGDLGPGYDASHLKSILDQSNIPALFTDLYPRLTAFARQKNPQVADVLTHIADIGSPMWKHPTAIYFSGLDFDAANGPVPKIVLLCDAGPDVQTLSHQLSEAITSAGADGQVKVFVKDQIVGLCTGYATVELAIDSATGAKLADKAGFKSSMKQLTPHPVATAYVDGERLLALIDQAVAQKADAAGKDSWAKARDAAGLSGVHSFAATSGFDGQDWETRAFIDAPEPRKGLALALTDPGPLSHELLSTVPQSATSMTAFHFDAAGAFTSLRSLVGEVNPDAQQMLDKVIAGAQMMIGKNIANGILQPLGDEWACYSAPQIGGGGALGMVLVNRLRDPQKAQQSLSALTVAISNIATAAARQSALVVPSRTIKIGDVSVTYFALPFISPAWAIKDGFLYVGLYPQTAGPAAQFGSSHTASILDNPKYTALLERLGNKSPSAVSYADLPQLAGPGYQVILAYSRLGLGISDLFGVPSPEPVIPPYGVVLQNLFPSGAVSWTDAAGWHSRDISPFPGADLLNGEQGGAPTIGVAALATSILLPSLNRARETANRVKCASNERGIGQGLLLYANEHRGKYPPDLGTLITTQNLTADLFICPSGNTQLPPHLGAMKPEEISAWVTANSDYVYCGTKMNWHSGAEEIVVYEKPGDHNGDGINILYGDGHVEFVLMSEAQKQITDQHKEMPGVDFSTPKANAPVENAPPPAPAGGGL